MEAKDIIAFVHEKDDLTFRFEIPKGVSLAAAYEASSAFLNEIVRMINEHVEQTKPQEQEEEIEDADVEESQEEK